MNDEYMRYLNTRIRKLEYKLNKDNQLFEIECLKEENKLLRQKCDRLYVLASKWCDKNHHDWQEILNLNDRPIETD